MPLWLPAPTRAQGVRPIKLAVLLLLRRNMSARHHRPSTRSEIFIGRSLAICAHPVAAWRTTAKSMRVILFAGYFAAGYVTVLALITLLSD